MKLDTLTLQDVEQIRIWRNQDLSTWRTPYLLTEEMQKRFYYDINKRESKHRYWAIRDNWKVHTEIDEEKGITKTYYILTLL